ncbi:MAG: acetyl-CoA acetyltransferase [Marivirga sp.]|jgi:acetyl-CoA acetyltransferase
MMKDAFSIDAVRTPIAKFRGGRWQLRADDLAALAPQLQQKRYALCTLYVGVGQGYATIIERV